jgi:hypothetical protein
MRRRLTEASLGTLLVAAGIGCAPGASSPAGRMTNETIRCPARSQWNGDVCVGAIACPANTTWDGRACAGRVVIAAERSPHPIEPGLTSTDAQTGSELPLAGSHRQGERFKERDDTAIGRLDVFLDSDVAGGWASIDGFPAPSPPAKTFLLQPGDHIVEIGASGFGSCRFTLRNLKIGQSVTVKALLRDHEDERGCGLIAFRERLGQMASFGD